MKIQSFFMVLAALAVVAGCTAKGNIDAFSQTDPYQKTIIVPSSTGNLTLEVTNVLKQNNWLVGTNQQPIRNPRYSLQLTYDQTTMCMPRFEPQYDYDLTITDLRMGSRVFAMHGSDCKHTILDHLNAYLNNKL